jgi:glycosyltransferase involved in cell wall biosynthesis
MFMHRGLLPQVIFSPGHLALSLAHELQEQGAAVTLFTPGPVDTAVPQITADLSLFQAELDRRGDTYLRLLKKHPFTFITIARQVQGELVADAYARANADEFDLVHVYCNEEELALSFASLCRKPVVFTHHDPYNLMVKYKSIMPRYKHLNWVSFSHAQRAGMPADTNWLATIPHGLTTPISSCARSDLAQTYVAYMGRIIEAKGVHLAIAAVRAYNKTAEQPLRLKIAGKHYSDSEKHSYWQTRIAPELDDMVEYVGFIDTTEAKHDFLSHAAALLMPSIFDEPFGMTAIEALACGTPVIALESGALPEIISHGTTGYIAKKVFTASGSGDKPTLNETKTAHHLQIALAKWAEVDRTACRTAYETRFTTQRMAKDYLAVYQSLTSNL